MRAVSTKRCRLILDIGGQEHGKRISFKDGIIRSIEINEPVPSRLRLRLLKHLLNHRNIPVEGLLRLLLALLQKNPATRNSLHSVHVSKVKQ
jgi:hypothetical protein